jgi:hypothetical protein
MSDERNGQTGETKQRPPAALGLFGLYGFAETPAIAVNQCRQRICGLFGLYGGKCHKPLRNERGRNRCQLVRVSGRQHIGAEVRKRCQTQTFDSGNT